MKNFIFKLKLLLLLFIASGALSYANLTFLGNSYFFVGETTYTWYTGSDSYVQPGGLFQGANLGIVSELYIGTQCQTYDAAYGTAVTLNYKIDNAVSYIGLNVGWLKNENNNQVWQSNPTANILSGKVITPGYHTVNIYLHAKNGTQNVYDNRGGSNYIANFTYPGLVMPSSPYTFPNTVVNASSIAKKVDIEGYGTTGKIVVSLSGTDADQFSLSATAVTLSANKGTFNVSFKPTTEGSKSAVVTISNGSYTQSFSVSGMGEPLPLDPSINGVLATYDFGKIKVGGQDDQMFEVVGANLSEPIAISATGDVSQFSLSVNSLPSTGGVFSFVYQPTVVGDHSITLTFSSEGADSKTTTVTGSSALPLVVRFKKPAGSWGTNVFLHAWNPIGGVLPIDFAAWPGKALSGDGTGWYSYAFPIEITSVDVIFNNNGTPTVHQTDNIVKITSSASYTTVSSSGTNPLKYKVSTSAGIKISGKEDWSDDYAGQSVSLSDKGSSFAIAAGQKAIVDNLSFTTDAVSSSQIINKGSVSVTGKVRTIVSFDKAESWMAVSFPYTVNKIYLADGITEAINGTHYYACEYDPAIRATGVSGWKFTEGAGLTFEKGYMLASKTVGNLVFEGEGNSFNTAAFTTTGGIPLSYITSPRVNDAGWNFVVQPNMANSALTVDGQIVYTYNNDGFTSSNQWTEGSVNTIPFQSYFVKTPSASKSTIDFGPRAGARAVVAQTWDIVSLSISDNQKSSATRIVLHPDATSTYNETFDAPKMFSFDNSVPQVWTNVGLIACDINGIESEGGTIPVSVRVPSAGSYALSLSGDLYHLTVGKILDKETGKETSLLNDGVYPFNTTASGVIKDRFELILSKVITDVVSNQEYNWSAFMQGSVLRLENLPQNALIKIADMTGRTVLSVQENGSSYAASLPQGLYLVSVNGDVVKINVSQ